MTNSTDPKRVYRRICATCSLALAIVSSDDEKTTLMVKGIRTLTGLLDLRQIREAPYGKLENVDRARLKKTRADALCLGWRYASVIEGTNLIARALQYPQGWDA